ncbi:uncharacterized protein N7483_009683 [Penicillium malachiteum]|uniref:uncharacterized protein n=1 Tax=Penicillium malachiteum TaxID=1324776 RepID=UPI0025469A94|nr:uncharacterized protein N7483_009683 [Penicillium malachiteum]KAJ5721749.1 hypothetical protein N7483_009683 [Penicillium malachiteum]
MPDENPPPYDPTKLKDFYIHDVKYKEVHRIPIFLSILVPKVLIAEGADLTERRPLITTFHGGFLIGGSRLYSQFIPNWYVSKLMMTHSHVHAWTIEASSFWNSVCLNEQFSFLPDYRLMPESTGMDILSDIDSFWLWLSESLELNLTALYPQLNLRADLDRIFLTGDSAGGFCVIQSLLRNPELNIKTAVAAYAMVDLHHRYWSESYNKPIFGAATVPTIVIENHLKNLAPNAVFSGYEDPVTEAGLARMQVTLSIIQNGKF